MDKARVESFSDGVFAFAITLLVLGIPIPDWAIVNDKELRSGLIKALHQLLPYLTSFATIGIIWLNHHAMFGLVARVDHGALILNLLLLLVVSFVPFPTAVLGRYVRMFPRVDPTFELIQPLFQSCLRCCSPTLTMKKAV